MGDELLFISLWHILVIVLIGIRSVWRVGVLAKYVYNLRDFIVSVLIDYAEAVADEIIGSGRAECVAIGTCGSAAASAALRVSVP